MPHIRTQCSSGPVPQGQQYQQPQYNQQNTATSQQSQRHAQHCAHQPMQKATQHMENRDGGVDPPIPTSESDTDRPSTYMSDVRKMTPAARAMELLTTYHVTKLEKRRLTMIERSLAGAKPWERTKFIIEDSLPQDEILEGLNEASRKDGRDLWARTAKYPPALQAQVDRATKDRERSEKDYRFVWELVQTDDELVPLQRNTEASDHEKPDSKYNESTRRYEAKHKEKMNSAAWSDSSSATGRRRSNPLERVAVTLYFMRSPRPGQNPVALYSQLRARVSDSSLRHDTPPKTVPVTQNEAPPCEPIPVAAEHAPPVRHSTRPPPPVPHSTRPAPAPQPDPRPVGVASWGQQLPKVSDTQQHPRPKQAAQSVPSHTGPRAQSTQAYQPASLHSESKAQAAQFTQASPSAPPYTGSKTHPTQTVQTAQCDPVYGEPRAGPTPSGQRARLRREPKPQAQPPQSSQPPPIYTDPGTRPAEVPPPAQIYAKAKVQLPQAAQSHPYMKQRHRPEQNYEQPQQSRQPAVPHRSANVPSPPPAPSSEPAQYQSHEANLNMPPSIHNIWDQTAGERRSRRQSPRRRTHKRPESRESTASYYDGEDEIFSDSGASMESASQYTFATASPKPSPARPNSDSTARVRRVDGSSSAGTARTVRDGWGPSLGDARLPSPKLDADGPSRPRARAPQSDRRASPGTERAAEMHSTYSDMNTLDPQSWGNVHSRGDNWWSGQAQGIPEIESDCWEDLIYSDWDEADEPSRQREAGDGNGGRESAGRGGSGRRSMHRGSAPRGNR
ncbi:hypothetical protein MY11210_003496 [Beauveria gryllotalpidicola]